MLIDRKPQWLLIPIASGSKNPGTLLGKNWPALASNDEHTIGEWLTRWPNCNMGLLLGPSSGVIDLEYDSKEGEEILEKYCADLRTPTYRSRKSVHRLFQWDNSFASQKAKFGFCGTEWRFGLDKAQSVIPPSLHESGTRYEWLIAPSECEVLPLPLVLRELLHDMQSDMQVPNKTVQPQQYPESSLINSARLRLATESWHTLLSRHGWTLAEQKGNEEHWYRPGKTFGSISASLNHQGSDRLAVFTTSAPPLEPDTSYDKFAFVCACEFSNDPVACARSIVPATFSLPAVSFVADDDDDLEVEMLPEDPGQFPADCLLPPGLIADVASHTLATSDEPQPILALAGAISLLSVITGRKIRNERNNRTNLFVLGLGPSGCGKERPRNVNTEILTLSGGAHYLGAVAIGSGHGVESQLREHPAKLFQLDEIGDLLKAIKKERSSGHMEIIVQKLKMLMTSSHTIYSNSAVSDSKLFFTIDQPHCCIFGTATAEKFWSNLSLDSVEDGFLGRIVPLEVSGYAETQHPMDQDVPQVILDQVKEWIDFVPSEGNLAEQSPDPVIYRMTNAAQDRHRRYCESIDNRIPKDGSHRATDGLWKRARGRAASLALLFAASRQGPSKMGIIELCDVELAIKIANWITRKTIYKIATQSSENQWESDCQRVFNIIRQGPLGLSALTAKTRWLRSRDRREVLETLIASGRIELIEEVTKTKKRMVYRERVNDAPK